MEIDIDRIAVITIGDADYPLLLTTKLTKEIGKKYGGLSELGDKLFKSEDFERALEEIIWLITELANQPIKIHNIQHPNEKKDELTEELVELLTTPSELTGYKDAIMTALMKGTKRNVVSAENPDSKVKN